MKKAINHGRKDVKPGQSKQNNQSREGGQSSLAPMPSAGMPMVDAPGDMLDPSQVPGAGFAPH